MESCSTIRKETILMAKSTKPLGEAPSPADVKTLTQQLSAPFEAHEVRFKPQKVTGNRALALAYVDARVIQDRLDDVLGVEGWQDEYECLPDGSVVCRLRLRLGGEWVTKMDVGSPSEQPDEHDRLKAAFSDALKRAAVKFGLGRYLYRLPAQWADYDAQKRQFVRTPALPASALPPRRASVPMTPKTRAARGPALPADGEELQRRLMDYDAKLAAQGVCVAGELLRHVREAGVKAGYEPDLTVWTEPAIAWAAQETKAFEAGARKTTTGHKAVA
jgi:hypothetical protein